MSEEIQQQVHTLNMILGNIVDEIPLTKMVEQRVGDGTGTVIFWSYRVGYYDEDKDYSPTFQLVANTVQIDLVGVFGQERFIDYGEADSDELGETFEQAVKSLQNHKWLKKS